MSRRPNDWQVPVRAYLALVTLTGIAFLLLMGYASVRLVVVIAEDNYSPVDGVVAAVLLAAELFFCMHATGYFLNLLKAARRQTTLQPIVFSKHATPSVAVLVAAFNEQEEVLEATFAAARAMDYPANFYLLDDSTRPEAQEGARRVAAKYGARLVHRTNRAGYKAGAINDLIPELTEKYIALLDADQRPLVSFLREMVAYMEEQPRLALVQTPQHYVNDEGLPVCHAARYQQGVFFEYICEGKGYSNAMFCCGSNCIIRREALLSIEQVVNGRTCYFDESSVTEDFATSFLLHMKGWSTDYVNITYAVGMGPETLPGYFTQQMRWAMGTQGQCRAIIKNILRNPRAMSPGQWWEYWLGGTYYFVGFANFTFLLVPMAFMVFDVRPVYSDTKVYLAFFIPYIFFTLNLFYFGMRIRKYSAKGVWLASALSFATFWIYMKAGMVAILGLKRAFGVTPKGVGGAIPLRKLTVELTMFIGTCVTALWGAYHLIVEPNMGYALNTLWATYHAVLLSTLFLYFNRPVTIRTRESLFRVAGTAA